VGAFAAVLQCACCTAVALTRASAGRQGTLRRQQTPVPVTQIDFKKPAKARAVVVDPWFPARAVSRLSCRFRPIQRHHNPTRCGDSRRARCGFGSCPPGVHLRRPSTLLSVSTPVAFSSHRRFRDRGLLISKPNLALPYHPVVAINAAADSVLGVAPGHWQQPHNQMLAPRYHRAGATNSRGHHGLPHLEAMVRHDRHMVSLGPASNRLPGPPGGLPPGGGAPPH